MSDEMDDLLKRFQALKGVPTDPPRSPRSVLGASDTSTAAQLAKREDDELNDIADDKPISSNDSLFGPVGSSGNAESDLRRRVQRLKGEDASEDDLEMRDDEASLRLRLRV
jgi:hypothetical protein